MFSGTAEKNNSFFTAVIPQLISFRMNYTESELRVKITTHLRDNMECYFGDYTNNWGLASLSFRENPVPFNPEAYLEDFKAGNTDADLLTEVLAFSRIFNIIVVTTNALNTPFVYKPNEINDAAGVIYIRQLGQDKNFRFRTSTAKQMLVDLINNTPIDGFAASLTNSPQSSSPKLK